jgi:hypothetical protein
MSEEDGFGDGHIEVSDDGNDGGVSRRGKKRQKGMKVGTKITAQPSGKSGSKVWDHFEKVSVPSTMQSCAMAIMAIQLPQEVLILQSRSRGYRSYYTSHKALHKIMCRLQDSCGKGGFSNPSQFSAI